MRRGSGKAPRGLGPAQFRVPILTPSRGAPVTQANWEAQWEGVIRLLDGGQILAAIADGRALVINGPLDTSRYPRSVARFFHVLRDLDKAYLDSNSSSVFFSPIYGTSRDGT